MLKLETHRLQKIRKEKFFDRLEIYLNPPVVVNCLLLSNYDQLRAVVLANGSCFLVGVRIRLIINSFSAVHTVSMRWFGEFRPGYLGLDG